MAKAVHEEEAKCIANAARFKNMLSFLRLYVVMCAIISEENLANVSQVLFKSF